ncbi:MAG: hypothetical protein IBJ14_11730 [Hydrogenophaga sp.]|nr:hypothetical protein [Hydrogenophaga sp.]
MLQNPQLPDASAVEDDFASHLEERSALTGKPVEALAMSRGLIIEALQRSPGLAGCIGFSELTNAISTIKPWPWRESAGPIADSDDLRLGDWLCDTYGLKATSRAALQEAIETVADSRRFHPLREWLQGLQWDGTSRLQKWLLHVLQIDPQPLTTSERMYFELMGRFTLMGHVARVMDPGCKFDYSPVLEGVTGIGKSTLVRVLVGDDYFSDTHFDIGGGKDGMEQLEGLWAYELAELTALRRADSEQVKQFFSSTVDRYRGAYGRYVQSHPRQCVIWCTTNKRQYLYDLTGNRRFWPVWVDKPLRIEWLSKWRGQLFAEALHEYRKGERYHPSREEEELYFKPQQERRLVETSVQGRLYELLTRGGDWVAGADVTDRLSVCTEFVTLPTLVKQLGISEGRSTNQLESQIRSWLEAHGWKPEREPTGQRRRGYRRPAQWPPGPQDRPKRAEGMSLEPQALASALDGHGDGDHAPF